MKSINLITRHTALLYAFLFWSSLFAQQSDSVTFPPFEKFTMIQYATTTGHGPQNILNLDNNGEIAIAAKNGITREELAKKETFSESQIALLKTFRLLYEQNDTLTTVFPILESEDIRQLREQTLTIAPAIALHVMPEIIAFLEELRKIGREENAYSILFSYVFDGLVWKEFEKCSLVDYREITAANPLWSGEIWALYPPRSFAPGTNSISEEGISLKVNWSYEAIPHMLPFVTDFPTLIQMFNDYKERGAVVHDRVMEVFGPYNLFDEKGSFTIPIIEERDTNSLYNSARKIAERIVESTSELINLSVLKNELGFRDEKQTLVVIYHELLWDIMDHLEAKEVIHKPVVFAEPNLAKPSDIAALVFIVKVLEE